MTCNGTVTSNGSFFAVNAAVTCNAGGALTFQKVWERPSPREYVAMARGFETCCGVNWGVPGRRRPGSSLIVPQADQLRGGGQCPTLVQAGTYTESLSVTAPLFQNRTARW